MGKVITVSAPEKLIPQHILKEFSCGEESLDLWLVQRALKNEEARASRTYVVCAEKSVKGYYTLAVGSVMHAETSGKVKRNMPDPIPIMILGRLAVDKEYQGNGIGKALLGDAILRTLQAAEFAGIRALLVHALNEEAKTFYIENGFHESPVDPMTLMITLGEIDKASQN